MTCLEELLLKWHDQTIAEDELRELNAALKEPASRKYLLHSFTFDAQILEALQALKAVEQTAHSAQQFETLELQDAPFPVAGSGHWLKRAVGRLVSVRSLRQCIESRWMQVAAALTALALIAAFVVFGSAGTIATIEGNAAGATVVRGGKVLTAKTGFALRAGDRIKTSADNSALLRYLTEPTQIKLQPGTQLKLDQDLAGKRLELLVGTITAKVAPQPTSHPMLISTPQAEAKVIGTEFLLTVDASSTHLEVIEGAVRISNRDEGKAVFVGRDHFATVARGAELTARSLLPAPWNSQDIGAVGMTGYARIEGHRCKIKAAGKGDAKSNDQFHFLYQALETDGEIRARVVDVEHTHNLAKAGVLIRDNLKPTCPQAFLYLKAGSGLEFEHRGPSDNTVDWAGNETAPFWLRLVKQGEWIRAYKSADGLNWIEVGSDQIKMKGKIYLGLGVSSWNNSKLTTSIFDNVNVTVAGSNLLSSASEP